MERRTAKEDAATTSAAYARRRRVRRFTILAGALLLWASAQAAPPANTAASGAILYQRYCASCHGTDAKGNGPAKAALVAPPTDLTMLARSNHGTFDMSALVAVIDGRRQVTAHGSREMPVWGAVFDAELKGQPYAEYTSLLRAKTLAEYLATIQQ